MLHLKRLVLGGTRLGSRRFASNKTYWRMSSIRDISLADITSEVDLSLRKTKIVCTLGPACWSEEGLTNLIDAGMDIARLNFSHGDHESHLATLTRLRAACAGRPQSQVAVLLDTKGPEIRTGVVDPALGKLKLVKGDTIEVGTDFTRLCTPDYLACSYPALPNSVKVGGSILIADGSLALRILECREHSVIAEILNDCTIGDRKNMNLPGAKVFLPTLTDKDVVDLQQFAVRHQVDFIAASFVRKGQDLDRIRQVLGEEGKNIKIISKIENQEGLENYDDILEKTDGIMVARGDLGMEIPLEKVFIAQKMMIGKANLAGKPVITATQMFESMIHNARPTRAECADVASSVLDGTDALMLSGETANGAFPHQAVAMMRNTCCEAEGILDYDMIYRKVRGSMLKNNDILLPVESLASSAVKSSTEIRAKIIIVLTQTGSTARMVSKYRPACPVISVTCHPDIGRQMQGYMRGVRSIVVPTLLSPGNVMEETIERCIRLGLCAIGDNVIGVFGEMEAGSTNNMRVYVVGE